MLQLCRMHARCVVSPYLYDSLLKWCWLGKRCSGRDRYWATFYICASADAACLPLMQVDWKIGTVARGTRDGDTGKYPIQSPSCMILNCLPAEKSQFHQPRKRIRFMLRRAASTCSELA